MRILGPTINAFRALCVLVFVICVCYVPFEALNGASVNYAAKYDASRCQALVPSCGGTAQVRVSDHIWGAIYLAIACVVVYALLTYAPRIISRLMARTHQPQ